ncbi:MAG: tetratricopeptide repeat protein [Spirochaetes bacterium]|nr:tetratricopeptide repeat protein [Spirochaetota bacterium]
MVLINKEKLDCIKLYEEGLKLYRNKQFNEALDKFKKALRIYPSDGPSKVFIERCNHFLKYSVPEDWDGVFEMKTK